MRSLTDRQQEVLNFISKYVEENSIPPTVREIGDHFSISLKAVQDHVTALRRKGYVSNLSRCPRSLRVLKDAESGCKTVFTTSIPFVKSLYPWHGLENCSDCVTVSEPFISKDSEYFAVEVPDSSMMNAGICNGDLAVIKSARMAEDGQIALILDGSAAVLRRYSFESHRICLKAECADIPPVYCQDVRVLGILTCIIRAYRYV